MTFEPPSKKELLQTTGLAAGAAAVALLLFVLPAEYGIDPLGFGGALGLTDEGSERADVSAVNVQDVPPSNETHQVVLPASGAWREVKWNMEAGMTVVFSWTSDFPVQFDLHSDELGSFDGGTAASWHGSFTAPEDGYYGWAFRTPSADATTLALTVTGHWTA